MFLFNNLKDKVGIFGDSFADELVYTSGITPTKNPISWPVLLADEHKLRVTNFARGGTSVFYSYKEFLLNRHKFESIVFVVTESSRLYNKGPVIISNLNTIEEFLATHTAEEPRYSMYLAAKMYYEHLYDTEYGLFVRDKIVEEVSRICKEEKKKLIFIPAFQKCKETTTYFNISLYEIVTKELMTQFGDSIYRKESTLRACHMSKNNNMHLANLVASLVRGAEIKITLNDFEFNKVSDPENYWDLQDMNRRITNDI